MRKSELIEKIIKGEVISEIVTESGSGMKKILVNFQKTEIKQEYLSYRLKRGENVAIMGVCDKKTLQDPRLGNHYSSGKCVFFPDHFVSAR